MRRRAYLIKMQIFKLDIILLQSLLEQPIETKYELLLKILLWLLIDVIITVVIIGFIFSIYLLAFGFYSYGTKYIIDALIEALLKKPFFKIANLINRHPMNISRIVLSIFIWRISSNSSRNNTFEYMILNLELSKV